MKRRDFLRGAGAFIVGAKLLGCGDNNEPDPIDEVTPRGSFSFAQGVASGDPRPDSVVLWTRVVQVADPTATVTLQLEVASDADFTNIVVDQQIEATAASDHTVRVLVTDLSENATFFYRFTAGVDEIVGRTHTAPGATADVQVNLAWVSCQDFQSGHFTAYQQMIRDDDERAEADRIHFVVHLGDVIYETIDEQSQRAVDNEMEEIVLAEIDGTDRIPARFPSGGGTTKSGAKFAQTVDDYRHLYKTFLADVNLQAARARWPFIYTWDDHEFTNDSWQSMANYVEGTTLDEGSQSRKLNASQAWFEYIPAQLTGATGPAGVTQDAKDFAPATVTDTRFTAPNADNFVDEANNAAAIGAMTIYRSLRWGKHVELVMTDQRSYRSDHAIPEDIAALINAGAQQLGEDQPFFDPRNFLPIGLVSQFDQGSTANGGNPLATILGIPNPRFASPPGTMLGAAQKTWWKDTMQSSDATWKLWGNEVPMMRMLVKNVGTALGPDATFSRVLDGDGWDGYPTERKELLTFLKDNNIENVVVLTGDIHAHFAGVLLDDFDSTGTPVPVATELITAGISSNSLFSFYETASRAVDPSLRALVTVDATNGGGPAFTENLNLLLTKGLGSAATFAGQIGGGAPFATARAAALGSPPADPTTNTHLRYVDTNAQGYAYAKITATEVTADLVTIQRPVGLGSRNPPGIKRKASFTIPVDNPGGMSAATITGEKPFPL
jgi:alkaline phosphatase D